MTDESTLVIPPSTTTTSGADPMIESSDHGPGLISAMIAEPGLLVRIVAEWAAVVVLGSITLAVAFLLALGCYSLLKVAP